MARPRVRMNSRGSRALLASDGVRKHLTERAERVRAAQGAGAEIWQDTTDRAVVRIGSRDRRSRRREADTGYMSRSLGAAGG